MSQKRNLAFHTLRHRDFRLLWIADTIAMLGTQMQRVAIIYQVYVLTESRFSLACWRCSAFCRSSFSASLAVSWLTSRIAERS